MKLYVVKILMSTLNIPILCRQLKNNSLNYRCLLPDLAPWLTLSGSSYLYLEQISMILNMFEPLKFDCIPKYLFTWAVGRSFLGTQNRVRVSHGKRLIVVTAALMFLHCYSIFTHPSLLLTFISSTSFLVPFLFFSGRRHKMTHKDWRFVNA